MNQELPAISTSNYTTNAYIAAGSWVDAYQPFIPAQRRIQTGELGVQSQKFFLGAIDAPAGRVEEIKKEEKKMAKKGRIVRVLIVDPHKDIPLEKSFLYKGDELITDLTDQELFFEIDIKGVLDKHNKEVRAVTVDKAATKESSKQTFLEPVRVRDLSMLVVSIAEF